MLERSLRPYPVRLVPEYPGDDGAEADDEEVLAAETREEKREVTHVEYGAEQGIEEVPWEEELAELHVVLEDADLDLAHEDVVSANILLLDQPEVAELLQMVVGDAGAAEVQPTLDFADADGFAVLEEVPVDSPGFAPQGVLQVTLGVYGQLSFAPHVYCLPRWI